MSFIIPNSANARPSEARWCMGRVYLLHVLQVFCLTFLSDRPPVRYPHLNENGPIVLAPVRAMIGLTWPLILSLGPTPTSSTSKVTRNTKPEAAIVGNLDAQVVEKNFTVSFPVPPFPLTALHHRPRRRCCSETVALA